MALPKLYSIKTAAEQLGGLSVWTLYGWVKAGRIKVTKIGRRTMIRESELARLIRGTKN